MTSLKRLQQLLGYSFKNESLLLEALTHKSFIKSSNNERLEFLGDAVLDLLVGEYLFDRFPKYNEGKLSKMRSSLVNEKSFAIFARDYGIGSLLRLSSSEEQNHGRDKDSLLSNAFEAIIGAIYKEAGIDCARKIVYHILTKHYPNMKIQDLALDYKTTLQEITQERFGVLPIYKLLSQEGPDHKKRFTMQILIDNIEYGTASGTSKKLAEQACAKIAYEKLTQDSPKPRNAKKQGAKL
ncbi:ribonuclease III [Helicobacter zhangjianzhongii]|uniref:Ribonuclease III n=1 Tax=Helicobacter zhangjianzhongii TaxID=2974574 RepID=A0ACC6FSQ4_9HELI|nr:MULTISPECIES: ribonuclease III [unclassified Helicobacter]MDL0079711.1 ribonuclease III [Helicobacter sp. CPD2-1]MDL0082195.1 ribonuclease III [Helicobacter sp. XJK30-2]